MLISLADLKRKYRLKLTGILHLGAHVGEEAKDYNQFTRNVTWVEANPELMPTLDKAVMRFGHKTVNALVSDKDGEETTFHVTNNYMSSSILELGTHKKTSPDVHYTHDLKLRTMTMDTLVREFVDHEFNFLNMDLQGAEVLALKGGPETIQKLTYVYTEVNTGYVYKGCGLLQEIDAILKDFDRVETCMTPHNWGDAFYIRKGFY